MAYRTPLYAAHQSLQARLVDFHGWEMPIQYAGILPEHTAVRTRTGLFDLSHMGRVRVRGRDRRAYLQNLLTVDVEKVPQGKCRYTFFLTEKGTIIDDLILYSDGEEDLLVVNASNREKDLDWMKTHLKGDVTLEDETFSVALLAIQGPRSVEAVRRVLEIDPSALGYYTFGRFGGYLVSRTGYTGEDGFEIFVPAAQAVGVWDRFIGSGIAPVGLGARDTLRTEAGMPLYGNDIDDTTTPLEAGLAFAVDLSKPGFIGQEALRAQGSPSRRLAGFTLETKRSPRHGYEVLHQGRPVGTVTSGTYSPTLEKSIAMAYVPQELRKPGLAFEIDVRGRREAATLVQLPFFRRKKS
ncbi:MAG TPA: glycine cleavage system aminomethyltransferase GcvT [Planctomycetota bacterium]|nr:glycine cleavage system aminomethyltransferase GcvT [Planctomycetota bacterium]